MSYPENPNLKQNKSFSNQLALLLALVASLVLVAVIKVIDSASRNLPMVILILITAALTAVAVVYATEPRFEPIDPHKFRPAPDKAEYITKAQPLERGWASALSNSNFLFPNQVNLLNLNIEYI